MIKLSGRSLTPAGYLAPESMNLSLEERQGSATLVISPEEAAPEIGSWLQDDEDPGAGIVWRVKTIEENRSAGTLGVQLEHIVNTLRDDVIFGKVTPGMISGNPNDTTCSARDAAAYILRQTGTWTLGDFEFTHADAYAFDGEDLFSALGKVTGTLDGAVWEYDLGVFPFRLHVRRKSSAAQCEMREGRNISTLKRVIDRTRMYTRFYPIGENDLKLAGGYVSRNEQQYGTVSRIETDQSKKTEAELIAWANERLKKHAEPTVTVTISGLDLARSTGEPMDALAVNRMCQVPLPEFGTTILETITRLQWRDKVNEPENVTVTMANNVEDIASLLNSRTESSRRSARAGAQKAGEDHAWFVDTETHVGLVAEAIIGPGDDGVDWSRVASLIVDGGGIHARVTRAEGYFVALQSQLEMTEESLRVGFENALNSTRSEFAMTSESMRVAFENAISCTRSEFQMTSESMRVAFENAISCTRSEFQMTSESMRVAFENAISCTRSEFQMTSESMRVAFENDIASTRSEFRMTSESMRVAFENDVTSMRSAIEAEAGRIGLVVEGYGGNAQVKRASLILAINNGSSSAHIDADEVYIGSSKSTTVISGKLDASDVTADWLAAKFANTSVLSTNYMFTKSFEIGDGGFTMNDYSCNVPDAIWALDLVQSGNTYTLKKKHFYSLDWQTVGTFSRATTLSGAWSSGILTVSASPQGNNYTAQLTAAPTTWDGNTGSRVIWDGTAADAQNGRPTGYTVSVDATVRYNAGVTDGKNAVTISKGSWSGGKVTFSKSEGTASNSGVMVSLSGSWSGNSYNYTIYDSWSGSAASTGYTGTIDATARYNAGYSAGESAGYSSGYSAGSNSVTPTASIFSGASADPGSAFEQRSISQSDGTHWYTYTANSSNGKYKNYKLYVDATSYGTARYNAGYSAGQNSVSVTITPSTTQNLLLGGSVSVYAQKNGTSVQGITVTAPSVHHGGMDSVANRSGNWYNFVMYDSSGNQIGYCSGDQNQHTGIYLPMEDGVVLTENNKWYQATPNPNVSGRTSSLYGYRYFKVEVPGGGGTHTPSVEGLTVSGASISNSKTSSYTEKGTININTSKPKYLLVTITAYADCQGTRSESKTNRYYYNLNWTV